MVIQDSGKDIKLTESILKQKTKGHLVWLYEFWRGNEFYETLIGNELAERGILYF